LGPCDAGGSAIDWVMAIDDVDFLDAAKKLKARYLPQSSTSNAAQHLAKLAPSSTDAEFMNAIASYYAACFDIFDEGRAYLEGRAISSTTARAHGVGYAATLIGNDLPKEGRAEIRRRMQDLGILRASGHDHFRGCVVVPLVDDNADVVGFYGRRVEFAASGQATHLYLPGPHRGVFNRRGVDVGVGEGTLIICEAVIDALSFLEQGIEHVTCTYGASGLTDEIVSLVEKHDIKHLLCAFDPDEAGDRGFITLQQRFTSARVERLALPAGLDVNACSAALNLRTLLDTNDLPPPVAMLPPPKPSQGLVDEKDDEATLVFGDRTYAVRGIARLTQSEALKVQMVIRRRGLSFSDTLDLFVSKARYATAVAAAVELEAESKDLKDDLMKAFHIVDDLRRRRRENANKKPVVEMSAAERDEAMALLTDPELVHRIVHDFDRCGVVGEEINKVVAYLGATSRKLSKPLAVMVQSTTGAGKSSLMDAVLIFVPDEEKEILSAMTGQALFYADIDLEHKVLALAEEEGGTSAAYSLKLLQSDGKLQLLTTVKDPVTQQNTAKKIEVKGPVSLLSSTTKIKMDEELLNRCIVLGVDESREQTRRIHEVQRELETLEGKQRLIERARLMTLHQNAQRLLKGMEVVNPHARDLTFFDEKTRARRDHMKYLTLMRTVALLHQYQREVKHLSDGTPYIEVTREDIELVNELSGAVLNRALDDLPPKTAELFRAIVALVKQKQDADGDDVDVWFTLRDIVDALSLSDTAVTRHLQRLQEAEYIETGHRGGHSQRLWYRVVERPNAFAPLPPAGTPSTANTSNIPPTHLQPPGVGGFSGLKSLKALRIVKTSNTSADGTYTGKSGATVTP
jgi:DNA-binding transcriptional ArsR family regulator